MHSRLFLSLKHNHRSLLIAITVAVVVVFGFGVPSALAQGVVDVLKGLWTAITNPIDSFLLVIGGLIYVIIMAGAQLLTLLTEILIWIASYNNFINEPIVEVGWVLVRDLANMVFIVALLYMAFNMVFGMRGKGGSLLVLIINAGLINFSKMIAGLFIDVSQVVMLTFVHGFYNLAAGNMLDALGITKIFTYRNNMEAVLQGGASVMALVGTLVVALVMVYVAVGVVLTIIIVLIGRIFQLWGLLIFSPLPWVGKLVPAIGYVSGRWWEKLGQYCVSGPVLTFYLWLAFTAVSLYSSLSTGIFGGRPSRGGINVGSGVEGLSEQAVGLTQAMSIDNILSFIVMIGILMLALQQANQFGIATASFAAKVRKGGHKWTMKGAKFLGGRAATVTGARKLGRYATAARNLFLERNPGLRRLLTKEGRKEKEEEKQAKASDTLRKAYYRRVLGKPIAAEQITALEGLKQRRAREVLEKMKKDEGVDDSSATELRTIAEEAVSSGYEDRARAAMLQMGRKGFIRKGDTIFNQFEQKFVKPKDQRGFKEFQLSLEKASAEKVGDVYSELLTSVARDPVTGDIDQLKFKDAMNKMHETMGFKTDRERSAELRNNNRRLFNIDDDRYGLEADLEYLGGMTDIDHGDLGTADFTNPKSLTYSLRNFYQQNNSEVRKGLAEKLEEGVIRAKKFGVEMTKDQIEKLNNAYKMLKQNNSAMVIEPLRSGVEKGLVNLSGGFVGSTNETEARNRLAQKVAGKQAKEAKVSVDKVSPLDQGLQQALDQSSHAGVVAFVERVMKNKSNFVKNADGDLLGVQRNNLLSSINTLLSPIQNSSSGFIDESGNPLNYEQTYDRSELKKYVTGLHEYMAKNDVKFTGTDWSKNDGTEPLSDKDKKYIDDALSDIAIYLRRASVQPKSSEQRNVRFALDANKLKNIVVGRVRQARFDKPFNDVQKDFVQVLDKAIKTLKMYSKANTADNGKPLDPSLQALIDERITAFRAMRGTIRGATSATAAGAGIKQSTLDDVTDAIDNISKYYKTS